MAETETRAELAALARLLAIPGRIRARGRVATLEAPLAGVRLRLAYRTSGGSIWLVARLRGDPRAGWLRLETARVWPARRRRARVLTGDLRFDGRVIIYGDPGLAAALMTAELRRRCLELLARAPGGLWLSPRGLMLARRADAPARLAEHVRALVGAWPLWGPVDPAARWAATAVEDPDRRVRAVNAGRLIRAIHRSKVRPEASSLVRIAACAGLPSTLREEAAALLGRAGASAAQLARVSTVDDPATVAVALAQLRDRPDGVIHVAAALAAGDAGAGEMLLAFLGEHGDARAVPALLGVLARDEAALHAAAFRALGAVGSPAILPWLREELDRRGPGPARCAAAGALRQLGARFPEVTGRLSLPVPAPGTLGLAGDGEGG